ncbi:MAG: histidine kinase [Oceanospirillaceae bacterium]|nr:histidine kinase [Oceanospirillaceae bacterium]
MSLGVQAPDPGAGDENAVRLVLLHDAQGKALVLLPARSLLNLGNIWSLTGRRLQTTRGEDAQRFFSQAGLQNEAGQKRLMASLPLIIDQTLEGAPALLLRELYSGLAFSWRYPGSSEQPVQFADISVSQSKLASPRPGEGQDEAAITRAVERFTALRIQQRLEDTLGLPALAPTTQKIIMLRSDPDAGVDDLVPVVRLDPSLSAQVMSWAVSPYYAAPGKVSSIDDAVIRVLGFDLVVNLALGIAMGQVLRVPDDMPRGSTPYWQQAVYAATLSEMLARKIPLERRPKVGLVYLSGLLHNFGYLVLAHLFQPQFSVLSRYIEANPHLEPVMVEQQVLNVTRDQIGGWLLDSWNLPAEVCAAIRQQQMESPDEEVEPYVGLLQLTTRLLRAEGLADGPVHAIEPALYERLGLTADQVADAVESLKASQDELTELTHTLSKSRAQAS